MMLEQLKALGWRDEDFIRLLEELLHKMKGGSLKVMENVQYRDEMYEFDNLQKRVLRLMKKLGIPFHLKGREYIQAAVIYYVQKESTNVVVTKEIYPIIAKLYNTTPTRVEKAIRYVCDRCFDQFNDERDYIFGNTVNVLKGRPSNREFITVLVDYILRGYDL